MFEHIRIYHLMKLKYDHTLVNVHSHDYYQMIYVIKGQGDVGIFDKVYSCKAKDLIFIRKNEPHFIEAKDMLTFEIKFFNEDDSLNRLFLASSCHVSDSEDQVKYAFHNIDHEIERNRPYRDESIKMEFIKILIAYLRYFNMSYQEAPPKKVVGAPPPSGQFYEVENFIRNHYPEKITVLELAKVARMEYKYFSKAFGKVYGIGPKQYLTEFRLEKVKELLLESDFTISEIALKTGFERIHNLDTAFFQNEEMTPGEFRERVSKMYRLNMLHSPAHLTVPDRNFV